MDKAGKPEPKKLYETPELIVYGTVRDLTNHVGPHRNLDGSVRPPHRTGL